MSNVLVTKSQENIVMIDPVQGCPALTGQVREWKRNGREYQSTLAGKQTTICNSFSEGKGRPKFMLAQLN